MAYFVNGMEVDEQLVKSEMERLRPEYEAAFRDMEPEKREEQLYEWSKENLIEHLLLKDAAAKKFPDIPEKDIEDAYQKIKQNNAINEQDTEQFKANIKTQIQIDKLISHITFDLPEPTEKEVERYYKQNTEHFVIPEMVHAAHIVLHPSPEVSEDKQKEELENVLQQIKEGADFKELAAKYSNCPDDGGSLGYFARGKMVQEFEDVVFSMEVGQVSDVFKTQFGYHVAKVLDHKSELPCELDQVRELIVKELSKEKAQKAITNFIDNERSKANIEQK